MSPKIIPTRIETMPPHTSNRRALMRSKLRPEGDAWAVAACRELIRNLAGSRSCVRDLAKLRHHASSKQMLRLNGLPVFKSAEIRDYCQLADATLFLQSFDLSDDFFR